jgi:hypothetical protein
MFLLASGMTPNIGSVLGGTEVTFIGFGFARGGLEGRYDKSIKST